MATILDRSLQQQLLARLAADYPHSALIREEEQSEAFIANLFYLKEHGLVEADFIRPRSPGMRPLAGEPRTTGPRLLAGNVRITARGMDFVEQDGGLSALWPIVNVRKV